jgi:hypothetical protein
MPFIPRTWLAETHGVVCYAKEPDRRNAFYKQFLEISSFIKEFGFSSSLLSENSFALIRPRC